MDATPHRSHHTRYQTALALVPLALLFARRFYVTTAESPGPGSIAFRRSRVCTGPLSFP